MYVMCNDYVRICIVQIQLKYNIIHVNVYMDELCICRKPSGVWTLATSSSGKISNLCRVTHETLLF